jgi:hypothetical protein
MHASEEGTTWIDVGTYDWGDGPLLVGLAQGGNGAGAGAEFCTIDPPTTVKFRNVSFSEGGGSGASFSEEDPSVFASVIHGTDVSPYEVVEDTGTIYIAISSNLPEPNREVDCSDGLDNDGDGGIDASENNLDGCTDGADNDGDGLTDRDDPDCQERDCSDGLDNDDDGDIDGRDSDCPFDTGEVALSEAAFIADDLDCSGTPGATTVSFDAGSNSYTLTSLGGDIWNDGDHFTFVYAEVEGDFDLAARIPDAGLTRDPVTDWAKSGIMARLDTTGSSKYAFVHKPNGVTQDAGNTQFTNRLENGTATDGTSGPDAGSRREWYRLQRVGADIFAYASDDGSDWGSPLPGTVNYGTEPALVGIVRSGGTMNCDIEPAGAMFDNVVLTVGAAGTVGDTDCNLCDDGIDNDGDGATDGDDADCDQGNGGVQGWSYGIASDGDIAIDGVTTAGTVAAGADFVETQLTGEGVVSAVVLSQNDPISLGRRGTATVLCINILAVNGIGSTGSLQFQSGLQGLGEPVEILATVAGQSVDFCQEDERLVIKSVPPPKPVDCDDPGDSPPLAIHFQDDSTVTLSQMESPDPFANAIQGTAEAPHEVSGPSGAIYIAITSNLPEPDRETACDNGVDDDGDGGIDQSEDSANGCTDGEDNDGDGLTDREDPDCQERICDDAIDNDDDGDVDGDDADCPFDAGSIAAGTLGDTDCNFCFDDENNDQTSFPGSPADPALDDQENLADSDCDQGNGGVQGWSYGVASGGDLVIDSVTVGGTVSQNFRDGGLERGGFVENQLTTGAGNEGLVSAIVLSQQEPITLNRSGTATILCVNVSGANGAGSTGSLQFQSGLQGAGKPVPILATVAGDSEEFCDEAALLSVVFVALEVSEFIRGDANNDTRVDIADAIYIVRNLFPSKNQTQPPLACPDAADANNSGLPVDLGDTVYLLEYLFNVMGTSTPPPPPFPACGLDDTPTPEGCPGDAGVASCP